MEADLKASKGEFYRYAILDESAGGDVSLHAEDGYLILANGKLYKKYTLQVKIR
jgi:hypothetical protein